MHHHTGSPMWKVGLSTSGSLSSKGWPLPQGMQPTLLAFPNLKHVLLTGLVLGSEKLQLKTSTGRLGEGTFTTVTAGLVSVSSQTFSVFFLLILLIATLGVTILLEKKSASLIEMWSWMGFVFHILEGWVTGVWIWTRCSGFPSH